MIYVLIHGKSFIIMQFKKIKMEWWNFEGLIHDKWCFPGDHNTICEKSVFRVSIAKLNIAPSLALNNLY